MSTPRIDLLFPKSVLIADDVNTDFIPIYKARLDDIFERHGTIRTDTLDVDSLHKTFDQLHLDENFKNLVDKIEEYSGDYLAQHGYSNNFISKVKVCNMWANKSNLGDVLGVHIHQGALLSGAYYLEAPTDSKLIFHDFTNYHQLPHTFTTLSVNYNRYDCIPGRMIIFKGDLPHSTNKQSDNNRIVISFNLKEIA